MLLGVIHRLRLRGVWRELVERSGLGSSRSGRTGKLGLSGELAIGMFNSIVFWRGVSGTLVLDALTLCSFVPATKITTPTKLRDAVHRAIVEVFTIRKLGIPISSMNSTVAEIPWIKNIKLQPSSTELISIHYPSGVPVEDLVNSLLPKAPAPKAVGPVLEVLPELSEEQLLEMSEEDATSYETLRDFTQRAEAINEAVVESRELVMDAVNRQRSVSLSAALSAPKASSPETETVNKELNLSEVPLEDAELKFAVSVTLYLFSLADSNVPPSLSNALQSSPGSASRIPPS